MIATGLLLFTCGLTRSDFIMCRLIVYRSKILFGENGAHLLHLISDLIVIILGVLATLGYFR